MKPITFVKTKIYFLIDIINTFILIFILLRLEDSNNYLMDKYISLPVAIHYMHTVKNCVVG